MNNAFLNVGGGKTNAMRSGAGDVLALDPVSVQKLYPRWQQMKIQAETDGQEYPQFNEWVQRGMYKDDNQMYSQDQ
jgi:hypothetical protein